MDDRIIIARKRSEDPTQNHLRDNKAEWNKGVSDFIRRVKTFTSALVDLKRAMNGWPVPALGLERSSIKNPLSPVVPKLLDGLANEYQTLAQDYQGLSQKGQTIVHEQEQYSSTRRKSQSEGGVPVEQLVPEQTTAPAPVVASESSDFLTKEGSNILTRLLTYIKTPFMFGDEDRYARRDMLKSSAALHKLLGEIGQNLVSRDKNAIPEAVYRAQQFMAQFTSEVAQPLLALNEAKALEMGMPVPQEEPAALGPVSEEALESGEEESEMPPTAEEELAQKEETAKELAPDRERFPMVVEFGVTRAWQQTVTTLDELIGSEGRLDTSKSEQGLLRREYRFPTRDSRQQAMVKVRTETTGVNIVHPASGVKTDEPAKVEEPVKQEEPEVKEDAPEAQQLVVPEPPPPPDLDQDQHQDTFEKQTMVDQWMEDLSRIDIPRQVSMLAVRLQQSGIEFDVDAYVNQLIRVELTLKDLVRNSRGSMTDKEYQEIYTQYNYIKELFKALTESITKAEQLGKAGEINLELKKFAQARVSRWLGKQWLSILRTRDYRARLIADRYVTSVGDGIDKFMDTLQQRKASVSTLVSQMTMLTESLQGLLDTLVSLADMHNGQAKIQQLRDKSRRQVSRVGVINEQTINKLRRNRDDLARFLAALKQKKEEPPQNARAA